jgi:CheY-like chemotaxis protein
MEPEILVVDDDKIIVETIVQALEEDEYGYEMISASDGFEAGLQVNHFKPDLLILDIMMPDINGYEVCQKIKTNPVELTLPANGQVSKTVQEIFGMDFDTEITGPAPQPAGRNIRRPGAGHPRLRS